MVVRPKNPQTIKPQPHHATKTSKEMLALKLPSGQIIEAVDDRYSDRLRCDQPTTEGDGEALGELLLDQAERLGRGRVVALVEGELAPGMERVGLEVEGVIPGFYGGERDCAVMGAALDEERGMVFCPTGAPAFDFWGGNRIGQNLFSNCLIALDAATGKRIWHFQFVRHLRKTIPPLY